MIDLSSFLSFLLQLVSQIFVMIAAIFSSGTPPQHCGSDLNFCPVPASASACSCFTQAYPGNSSFTSLFYQASMNSSCEWEGDKRLFAYQFVPRAEWGMTRDKLSSDDHVLWLGATESSFPIQIFINVTDSNLMSVRSDLAC